MKWFEYSMNSFKEVAMKKFIMGALVLWNVTWACISVTLLAGVIKLILFMFS